ncbi:hypothetical protein KI387_003376, partial [Taxus chinensis]
MGEQGFEFPVSQAFLSPEAALLHKARCLEGKQAQMESPSDFVLLNGAEERDDQRMGSSDRDPLLIPTQLPRPFAKTKEQSSKRTSERGVRYAFKTRSETDIMEDGYKWRKYGKKCIKNTPNP